MSTQPSKIGVVGLWHLGCTLSACWSGLGHEVVGLESDAKNLEGLKKGEAPLYEPGLNDALKKTMAAGKLSWTANASDLADCDYVFISYDTPVLDNDDSDLTPILETVTSLKGILKNGAVVVISSQMPAGTCVTLLEELQAKNRSLELVYSPENLRLGEAISSYMNPGRIIIGAESAIAKSKVEKLFSEIKAELLFMNLTSAEMVKHGINSFLATSITYANHLSDLCEVSGADVLDVIRGVKSDPRIGYKAYLAPGIGFSGGTLGRDLKVLSHLHRSRGEKNVPAAPKASRSNDSQVAVMDPKAVQAPSSEALNFFGSIYDLNGARKHAVLDKLTSVAGGSLVGVKVGVLGLTYKPGTSTLRRSTPADIVRLVAASGAEVSVFDPKADYSEWEGKKVFNQAGSMSEAVKTSDIVVLLTEWPEFISADWKNFFNSGKPQSVLDTKNVLSELGLGEMGFKYFGTGRS